MALDLPQSVSNSLIPFWLKIDILCQKQRVWKVVYTAQIQCREIRELLLNGRRPLHFLVGAILRIFLIRYCHRANNSSMYAHRFFNSMINDKDGHIP